jgi:transposase
VDPSQIYDWRRKLFRRIPKVGGFVPVVVTPEVPVSSSRCQMEIVCGNGRRIIVDRDVDVAALLRVLVEIER